MRQTSDPVLNTFPVVQPSGSARVALVGGFPDHDDCYFGAPLSGEKGRLLEGALGHVGIARNQCFVGNVLQVSPPSMRMESLAWDGPEVQGGIAQLRSDLEKFRPTIVLCLGNEALHLFRTGNQPPPRRGKDYAWPTSVMDWRGSLFGSAFLDKPAPFECPDCGAPDWSESFCLKCGSVTEPHKHGSLKCLAAIHPSWVLRDYSLQAYYRTGVGGLGDLERLREESRTRELELPHRRIKLYTNVDEIVNACVACRLEGPTIAFDIEGHPGNITSFALASRPEVGHVFPLARHDGTSLWCEEDELRIWEAIKGLLEDSGVVKIAQNGAYDTFALAWTYGIVVHGWQHDTMLSMWELFAELKKGLATQASLFTKEPFYKPDKEDGELKFESDEQFWRYNGVDACVTFECWEKELTLMTPGQRSHYEFNCSLLPAILFMMLRGIRFDREVAQAEQEKALTRAWELQAMIDGEAAYGDLRCLRACVLELQGYEQEASFAELALRCLGGKNPRVKVQVTEERWQPMRWNGKKWVRDGKMVKVRPSPVNAYIGADEPQAAILAPETLEHWFKEVPRQIERLQPFTPTTLSDCDPHILESKRAEWRRVRQLWKEIRANEHRRQLDTKASEQDSRDSVAGSEAAGTALSSGTDGSLSRAALLGELSTLLGLSVNVGSTNEGGDAQRFLFEVCGLPRIYKCERSGRLSREPESAYKKRIKENGVSDGADSYRHNTSTVENPGCDDGAEDSSAGTKSGVSKAKRAALPAGKRLSTDQAALDKLYAETEDVRVLWCLQLRRLRKVATDLTKKIDDDGRIRASISMVKETGRMAESESPTGTGTNRHAWNKDLRRVCVADEGCEFGQQDLKGADSWTVACECAAVGDTTMLDDLLAGMKPAEIMCAVCEDGVVVNAWERQIIAKRIKELSASDKQRWSWLYPANKSGHHGADYGMAWKTLADTVLKYSMADLPLELTEAKPVVLTRQQAIAILEANHSRYPGLRIWHAKEAKNLMTRGLIETSGGHVRRFYGRKVEISKGRRIACHDTLKEALATKPQWFTTYCIKLALKRLWYVEENREADGSLKVEPLVCVHDSLLSQWKRELRDFARVKLKEWFHNEVEIAGRKIVIPYDGTIGFDWSMKGDEVERL